MRLPSMAAALLSSAALIGSSSTSAPGAECETPAGIYGSWSWTGSVGGYTGDYWLDVEQLGFDRLDFLPSGHVQSYLGWVVQGSGTFEFVEGDWGCRLYTDLDLFCLPWHIDLGSDRFAGEDVCADGFTHYFERAPDVPVARSSWTRLKMVYR